MLCKAVIKGLERFYSSSVFKVMFSDRSPQRTGY